MRSFWLFAAMVVLCSIQPTSAQRTGLKTNMLYVAGTTPNMGLELRTGDQLTVSLHGGYNPFSFASYTRADGARINPKIKHWVVMPEMKYWFCRAFERSYIGLHAIYGEYNVGGISWVKVLKDYRYRGHAYGGGVSVGYQWAIGHRWGLEASLGAGYLHLKYKKYDCGECGDFMGEYTRDYFGPTKAALNLIYFFR